MTFTNLISCSRIFLIIPVIYLTNFEKVEYNFFTHGRGVVGVGVIGGGVGDFVGALVVGL